MWLDWSDRSHFRGDTDDTGPGWDAVSRWQIDSTRWMSADLIVSKTQVVLVVLKLETFVVDDEHGGRFAERS